MGLDHLKIDVLRLIADELQLEDILSLASVSKRLKYAIDGDRNIWFLRLRTAIHSHDLLIPSYWKNVFDASSYVLRSWLLSALLIQKSLRLGYHSSILRIQTQTPITWVHIIRGRWLLVASSDTKKSTLCCWDSKEGGVEPVIKATCYLKGPVIDGKVDDNGHRIIIAVTLEIWPSYSIQILSLEQRSDEILFTPLKQIQNASFVRMITSEWLGYSVSNGNDTNAQLFKWTTGETYTLERPTTDIPHQDPESKAIKYERVNRSAWVFWTRTPCYAMIIWKSYVLTVFSREVIVYSLGEFAAHVCTFKINDVAQEATFLTPETSSPSGSDKGDLRLLIRHENTSMVLYSFHPQDSNPVLPFVMQRIHSVDPELLIYQASEIYVGTANGTALWVSADVLTKPVFHSLFIQREGVGEQGPHPFLTEGTLSTIGMPLLTPRCTMALDDARGVLLIGSISGDLCLVRFDNLTLNEWVASEDEIPEGHEERNQDEAAGSVASDFQPIEVWPHIRTAEVTDEGKCMNASIQDQITSTWTYPSNQAVPPGWSTDWSRYKHTAHWFPPSRRLHHDCLVFAGEASDQVCASYGRLGIPVPVIWRDEEEDPDSPQKWPWHTDAVLFRIGDLPYFYKDHRVFTLWWSTDTCFRHLTLEEALSDPDHYLRLFTNDYFELAFTDFDPIWSQQTRCRALHDAIHYISTHPNEELVHTTDPEKWSSEEWERMNRVCDPAGF